jgi:hypothetical protein
MELKVHTRSTDRRLFIENAVRFYAAELNISKLKFKLDVRTVTGLVQEVGARGVAQSDVLEPNKKELTVFLDSRLSTDKLISTLAHEMVHIKQMVRGQYWSFTDDYGDVTHFWRGKPVKSGYFKQPWELEAWAKERLLSVKLESIIYDFDSPLMG